MVEIFDVSPKATARQPMRTPPLTLDPLSVKLTAE